MLISDAMAGYVRPIRWNASVVGLNGGGVPRSGVSELTAAGDCAGDTEIDGSSVAHATRPIAARRAAAPGPARPKGDMDRRIVGGYQMTMSEW